MRWARVSVAGRFARSFQYRGMRPQNAKAPAVAMRPRVVSRLWISYSSSAWSTWASNSFTKQRLFMSAMRSR